ncbi:hypothetical protein Fuma_03954 [Fuerstiella marisgermanici]|uniref:Uncharacterized protein n=1 Tax=Fuerstiella marisgermanici TaxID=1891926 RepID=A0A1P8WJU8_9PLAN|nr:hypothetical protein Fuma_03954 [Fuerstiella marisgermanici]
MTLKPVYGQVYGGSNQYRCCQAASELSFRVAASCSREIVTIVPVR